MSTLVAGTKSASMLDLISFFGLQGLTLGSVTATTPSLYRITVGTITVSFTGNFTYGTDGHLTGGAITGLSYQDTTPGGQNQYTVSGFNLPVATFLTQLNAGDTDGFLAALFGGNDTMTGSALLDILIGQGGDDKISGLGGSDFLSDGAGADTLIGGTGNDVYAIEDGLNTIIELAGQGIDTIQSDVDFDLSVNGANIEELELYGAASKGTGNALHNLIIGNINNDTLLGGAGDDSLVGSVGGDSMDGGAGDDVYEIDSLSDAANDTGGGDDMILSSIDLQLGVLNNQGIEHLILLPGATVGTGDKGDNFIVGNDANNTLDGREGKDSLAGGSGDDTYFVDDAGDIVGEDVKDGTDTVKAAVSYTLAANLENLQLTTGAAAAGTGNAAGNKISDISGAAAANKMLGLAGDDSLDGADGADTLDGGAGKDTTLGGAGNDSMIGGAGDDILQGQAGNDTMTGGAGNDVYIFEDKGDVIVEAANQGIDKVIAQVDIDLLAANIENVDLLSANKATGNELANLLKGNASANTLSGGLGNDTLIGNGGTDFLVGGKGNDSYEVDDGLDQTSEIAGEGLDTVLSSALSYTLNAEIENLTLLAGAANGQGNTLNNIITGNDSGNVLTGGGGKDTLIGGKGDDVYTVDDLSDKITELANQGNDLVEAKGNYTLGANLENMDLNGAAVGIGNTLNNTIEDISGAVIDSKISGLAGNDRLLGATGNDTLDGGAGNDTLGGGSGADSMLGGAGNDYYFVDAAGDVAKEAGGQGTDTIESTIDVAALAANVENLLLSGSATLGGGNELNNAITGGGGKDSLTGGLGNDTLDGGAGADSLVGGKGNDTYIVDSALDLFAENPNEGIDTIQAAFNFDLATGSANIENLTLLGGALTGKGDGGANVITGNNGNNTLDGAGGNDTMAGGAGDDDYAVDSLGDKIVELLNGGSDTVNASVNHILAANVEALVLSGSAVLGTGNNLNNVISGSIADNKLSGADGNDTLSGGIGKDTIDGGNGLDELHGGDGNDSILGGAASDFLYGELGDDVLSGGAGADFLQGDVGSDTMLGGADSDSYLVDSLTDKVVEAAGQGTDRVIASVDITQLANNVENLQLTGAATLGGGNALNNSILGDANADSLTGAAGNDSLVGMAGSDTLDGGSGNDTLNGFTGNDSLVGGAGNDTYVIGINDDTILEAAGGGTDTVLALIDFDLGAIDPDVENLTLNPGSGKLSGKGNGTANLLTGNEDDNMLDGAAGNDTMVGGKGNDTYVVDVLGDKITELANAGTDTVKASVADYTLGANLENLELTNLAFSGTGNTLDNKITGTAVGNKLAGLGGNDRLEGLDGNDTLDGGIGNDTLLGGNADDSLIGAAGSDSLFGDAGSDTMSGGLGDDVYWVVDANDHIIESAGQGFDTVFVSLDGYKLAANSENLITSTFSNLSVAGNELNNIMSDLFATVSTKFDGGLGNDTIFGGGGSDQFTGGGGRDLFAIDEIDGNDDTITDFQVGVSGDTLNISMLLTGYVPGLSDNSDFVQFFLTATDTIVQVDVDGAENGVNFQTVAVLQNVQFSNVNQAIIEGNLDLT